MKVLLGFLALVGVSTVCLADGQPVVFYAQLIRGTDQPSPVGAVWKPVGPKLSSQLCPKFRWKNYWEVSRKTLNVHPGKITRVRLHDDREMEVEWAGGQDSEIRLFTAGKLVRKSRQPLQSKMTIMGGGLEDKDCWFIVVRRDKPSVE